MNPLLQFLLMSGLSLSIMAVVIHFYKKNFITKDDKGSVKENSGQDAVNAARSFARAHEYRFIAPAKLARNGVYANMDALVMGYFGILGVKAMPLLGDVFGSTEEERWMQTTPKGGKAYFPNPLNEASSDVRVIRDALFEADLRTVPVEVVVVFTNPRANLALPRSNILFTQREFKDYLEREKFVEDTGLDLDAVEQAVRAAVVED